ncbi:MAG: hypothetical protein EOM06_03810 [Sphingobacteriia bacterium]|nr:hypothetical protein [Sphingobacteriia bacterium]
MNHFQQVFNRNSYLLGGVLSVLSPVALYFLIKAIFPLIPGLSGLIDRAGDKVMILSVLGNLFWLRYYLAGVKQEHSGKAVLAVTFILVIIYFIFYT